GRAAQRRRARGETQTRGAEHLAPAPGRSVTDLPRGHPFPHRGDGRVQPGAAALARALRVPVVPVGLIGAHDAMPVGSSWPKPGRKPVRLLIGQPVRVQSGEALTDLNDRIEQRVRAMVETRTVEAGVGPDVVEPPPDAPAPPTPPHDTNATDQASEPK